MTSLWSRNARGCLSMGSEGEKERTAHRILNEHLKALTKSPSQQAFIVHRLDRETSGLMMFARSRAIQAVLQENWKTVTKKYLAIVEGAPANAEGTLRDNLIESKSLKMHRVERGGERGDHALSRFTNRPGQLAGRANARNRPQKPNSRADGRPRSSYRRRSQVWRDDRSRAAPRTPFIRAEVLPSSVRRPDELPQPNAGRWPIEALVRKVNIFVQRQTNDTAVRFWRLSKLRRARVDVQHSQDFIRYATARLSQSLAASVTFAAVVCGSIESAVRGTHLWD